MKKGRPLKKSEAYKEEFMSVRYLERGRPLQEEAINRRIPKNERPLKKMS